MTSKRNPIRFSDIFLDDEILQKENAEIWNKKGGKKSKTKKF